MMVSTARLIRLILVSIMFSAYLIFFLMFISAWLVWVAQSVQWLYAGNWSAYPARLIFCEIFQCPANESSAPWAGIKKIFNWLLDMNMGAVFLFLSTFGILGVEALGEKAKIFSLYNKTNPNLKNPKGRP